MFYGLVGRFMIEIYFLYCIVDASLKKSNDSRDLFYFHPWHDFSFVAGYNQEIFYFSCKVLKLLFFSCMVYFNQLADFNQAFWHAFCYYIKK